ncbi:MAG: DoxX family protein [Janthinobacterium lividum]
MSVYTNASASDDRTARAVHTIMLIVRIALGLPFIYHGASIAFGAFGGPGLQGFSAFTHLPLAVAALVGYGEFLGGLGVLFGVLARPAAAGLAIIMLGAITTVHLKNGYDSTKGGFEYQLTLLFLEIIVMIGGAGIYNALTLVRPKKDTI